MNDLPHDTTDVLIVGGGPSGLIASLLLAELNVSSIVVERNAFTDEHPKAHELNARSIEILQYVGITEEVLSAEASDIDTASRILFCRTINEELGRIDLFADPDRKQKYDDHLRQTLTYLNLSQSEFEKILVAHVEASPLIDLRFAQRWESFEETENGLRSIVSDSDRTYTVQSKYLFGCDGASSRVRRAIGIEMEGPVELQSFVNAYFKTNLLDRVDTRAKLYWIIHPEYAGTLVAHHMEKRWVYAVPVQTPWEQPEDFTPDVMRARIEGALGFEVPELEIASTSTWHMTAQIAQRYRSGRVFLLGDAAHRFPPTGGLGMNTGIADAHNLCWKLARVMAGQAGDALLDTYEAERKPIAERNCDESHTNFDKIFEVIEAVGLDRRGMELFARLMSVPPIRWLPPFLKRSVGRALSAPAFWLIGRSLRNGPRRDRVQTAIAAQVNHFDRIGLDIGYVYNDGAVLADGQTIPRPKDEVSEYIPTTAPGARVPHAWVKADDGMHSTHDCISYDSFTLLAPNMPADQVESAKTLGMQIADASGFPPELFPSGQALLVRPDGHVAWRGSTADCDAANLERILGELLSMAPSSAPEKI